MPRAQTIGVRVELRKHGIQFADASHGRSVGKLGAVITGRFQLARAKNALLEGGQFVLVDRGARSWIGTDHRRMRNWNSLLLQSASGILQSASHPRILLGKN